MASLHDDKLHRYNKTLTFTTFPEFTMCCKNIHNHSWRVLTLDAFSKHSWITFESRLVANVSLNHSWCFKNVHWLVDILNILKYITLENIQTDYCLEQSLILTLIGGVTRLLSCYKRADFYKKKGKCSRKKAWRPKNRALRPEKRAGRAALLNLLS